MIEAIGKLYDTYLSDVTIDQSGNMEYTFQTWMTWNNDKIKSTARSITKQMIGEWVHSRKGYITPESAVVVTQILDWLYEKGE